MKDYQICKHCKSVFEEGTLYSGIKCPICENRIQYDNQIIIRGHDELKLIEQKRFERTSKKLERAKKAAGKDQRKKDREAKKALREEKKILRAEKQQLKNLLADVLIEKDAGDSWLCSWRYKKLPIELVVDENCTEHYVVKIERENYEITVLLKSLVKDLKYGWVAKIQYDNGSIGMIELDRLRKFIKGSDSVSRDMRELESYLSRAGNFVNVMRMVKKKKKE